MAREWRYPCEFHSAYDGDTFRITLDLGFGLSKKLTTRLGTVDTPEIRSGSTLTKKAARHARDEVTKYIRSGVSLTYLSSSWSGKYGRAIGDIEVDGELVSNFILRNRLGVEYDGGSRLELMAKHEANAEWLSQQDWFN